MHTIEQPVSEHLHLHTFLCRAYNIKYMFLDAFSISSVRVSFMKCKHLYKFRWTVTYKWNALYIFRRQSEI